MSHKQGLILHADLQDKTCSFNYFTAHPRISPSQNISREVLTSLSYPSLGFVNFCLPGQPESNQSLQEKRHFI